MRAPVGSAVLVALLSASPVSADVKGYDALASRADLVVLGQILQIGHLDGEAVATIAIDRQISGLEAAGALSFTGRDVDDWRVGERSAFFLRRRGGGGVRFVSIAGPGESLSASAALLPEAPVRSASLRRPPHEPTSDGAGLSLPGVAAGLLTAAGILALSRHKRRSAA
ncbi:MAG TPA: hypothetical protein VGD74_07980 [Vulgatibacter sp.]